MLFRKSILIYLLIVIEGFCAVGIELGFGKILSSIYGSSLIIWTVVIAITLAGLSLGYFTAGILSSNNKSIAYIKFTLLIIIALLSVIFFYINNLMLFISGNFTLYYGSFLLSFTLLFPIMFLFGLLSPLIIHFLITSKIAHVQKGKIASTVYFLSTLGSLLGIYLSGFFFIPEFGIIKLIFIICISTTAIYVFFEFLRFQKLTFSALLVILTLAFFSFKYTQSPAKYPKGTTSLYHSEGMMGQLKVFEREGEYEIKNNQQYYIPASRWLYINGIPQTNIVAEGEYAGMSRWAYPHIISTIASTLEDLPNKQALLLGVGGGSIANELLQHHFRVDAVDVDERMFYLAKNYFHLPKTDEISLFVDDARHFLSRNKNKKYNLIVVDIVSGEVQPSHLFTIENFELIYNCLLTDSYLIINYQGQPDVKSASSIYHTLKRAGFYTTYFHNYGDIIITASKKPISFQFNSQKINSCCKYYVQNDLLLKPDKSFDMNKEYVILTDNQPILDMFNQQEIESWRMNQVNKFLKENLKENNYLFR